MPSAGMLALGGRCSCGGAGEGGRASALTKSAVFFALAARVKNLSLDNLPARWYGICKVIFMDLVYLVSVKENICCCRC